MDLLPGDVLKLLLAVLVGGVIGAEREYRDKAAGLRTLILICLGATLFTLISLRVGAGTSPDRIAANVVSGVGFLGAGVILREGGRIIGLTTAATIWLAAALGMAIGAGAPILAGVALLAVLAVVWVFPWIEQRIDSYQHSATYEITCGRGLSELENLEQTVRQAGLRQGSAKYCKVGDGMVITIEARGTPAAHRRLAQTLLSREDVKEFRV